MSGGGMGKDLDQVIAQAEADARSKVPADMAKIGVFRKGTPSPTVIVCTRDDAERAAEAFADGQDVEVQSYPDGTGRRSRFIFKHDALDGVLIEVAAIQLVTG